MELNVPKGYTQITRCFATNTLEDGSILTGICTTSGQFLEFVDDDIVGHFNLDNDADDLIIFTSYNPLQKYYLIRCLKKLIVIKRARPLNIMKTYEGVTRVEIRDRLCIGRPQVVIWLESERQPIVTDFVNQLLPSGPQPVPALTIGLSTKLQEMNLRLEKARRTLQDKKRTRMCALYRLCPLSEKLEDFNDGSEVLAWGPGPPTPSPAPPLQPVKLVRRNWMNTHNGKWVIGIPLLNESDSEVEYVRLSLFSDSGPILKFETQLLVLPQKMPRGSLCAVPDTVHELFLKQDTIPPKTPAIVMGVLDEMAFNKSSEISIFAVVLYRKKDCGTSFQLPLDSAFQFTVSYLIEGNLETFLKPTRLGDFSDPDDGARDFFTAIVSSTFYQLKVDASVRISVTDKLSDIGLKCIMAASNESPSFWAGYPPGCLRALVVICIPLSSTEYRLDVYAKDTKQVLLLAHRLSPFRVQEWRPENKSGLPECARSLSDELRLLLSAVQHPNKEYSPKAWADFKKNLSALEMKTDLDFNSYKPSS